MSKRILYIHGFNSSPGSMKAQQTQAYFAEHFPDVMFHCPQVASSPNAALEQLDSLLARNIDDDWCLIGSSLGGYFSTYFAEKYHLPAVLINPAVTPYLLLADYIGEQTNPYTGECYQVKLEHMAQLKALEQQKITQKFYQVMVQTGDEVLDYREAVEKFVDCELIIQQGGDHSFIDYETMLPNIARFLQYT